MSLRALSQKASVAVAILARLESEYYDPQLSTLTRIADALGVRISELIGETNEDQPFKVTQQRRDNMKKKATDSDKEAQKKLNEASRAAKKALEEWRKKYIDEGMGSLMWGYDYEEVELIIKLLQLKLRNQQDAAV
ncbi:MAG: helix-turn-helix transcriptional regulator [Nitrospira sp.]|nr:helix-turn-helix transcriptional regulator [Nitrospira sp.]